MLQDHANPNIKPVWQSLRVLTFYRVILAGLITVLYLLLYDSNPFSVQTHSLFRTTLLTWLAFSVVVGFATRLHWPAFYIQTLIQILADIVAIALLMYSSGGINSSLSVLLFIAVASGALILPGRLAYLFAAAGTLALLATTGLAQLSFETTDADDITRAGLFGAALFITAALAHALALRVRESEALATQRGVDLEDLQQLNQYIIGQLHSGVLVIDEQSNIRLANKTARTLLGIGEPASVSLQQVAADLYQRLDHWQRDNTRQPEPIQSRVSGITLLPRFSRVQTGGADGALILLEDSSRLEQQAQQIKLASLGRLTASIAHEIRNPLSAINHAAQLLEESDTLNQSDKRLTEIISNHTQRVDAIIESVLQLSRRSTTQAVKLPVKKWLLQFRDDFSHMENYAAEKLRVDVQLEGLSIRVDPAHLDQVLTNLCENAFRHAGQNAQIILKVRSKENGNVQLDVIDNGPGIDEEMVAQIFEPFFTTAGSGTGLGLYIARELCEINRAHLSYKPLEEGGSCFRILFTTQQNQEK